MALRLNRFKRAPISWPFTADLDLPFGLCGFEDCRDFLLVGREHEIPFLWLEAKAKNISFVVMDPFIVDPDYNVVVSTTELSDLGIKKAGQFILLAIVNTKAAPFTINLAAPLLIDWQIKKGKQILVPASHSYPIVSTIF